MRVCEEKRSGREKKREREGGGVERGKEGKRERGMEKNGREFCIQVSKADKSKQSTSR